MLQDEITNRLNDLAQKGIASSFTIRETRFRRNKIKDQAQKAKSGPNSLDIQLKLFES